MAENKIHSILSDHIPGFAFVTDSHGTLIDYNEEARIKIQSITSSVPLFNLFDKNTADSLEKLFIEARDYKRVVRDELSLKLGAEEKNFNIVISSVQNGLGKNYVVSAIGSSTAKLLKSISRFSVSTENVEELIKDKNVLEIFELVKSSFPFTFIGKNNLQKRVDQLDEYFWIKDKEGRYSLVNRKFAAALGLKPQQIEGKTEFEFLPKHLTELNQYLNKFLNETSNTLIMQGIHNYLPSRENKNVQIIEFPINDIDNNVVAIIGLSCEIAQENNNRTADAQLFESSLFRVPEAMLIADGQGKIVSANEKFNEFFNLDGTEAIKEKNIENVLDEVIINEFNKFKESEQDNYTYNYPAAEQKIVISFKKIFDESDKLLGYGIYSHIQAVDDFKTNDKVKMYDVIMEASPEAMFIYDVENLKFLEVNNAALKLYGYSRSAFLQMDLTDLYAPEDIQTLLSSAKAVEEERVFTGPFRHKNKSGDTLIIEISKAAINFKERKAHLNIIRDISGKADESKKIQMYKAAFDNSSDLILITDQDGFINFSNESVARELGYSKMDLEGKAFLSLVSDRERAKINTSIFHSGEKKTISLDVEMKKSNGDLIETQFHSTPILDMSGQIESFNLLIKPVHKEEKIVEVEKEVIVKEKSDESGNIDADFLSNVFHEILTPINVIIGFGQELTESIDNPNEEQKEAADIIKENQKSLLQIMDTVSEYTSLEQNTSEIKSEEITFVDIIDDLMDNIKKVSESTGVELTYGRISSSLKFETDKSRLLSILTEAAKFALLTTQENKVYLSAYFSDDDKCLITFKDDRDGISERLLNAFHDFNKQDENTIRRNYGISRFTSRLYSKLVKVLNIESEDISKNGSISEFALVFPKKFEPAKVSEPQTKSDNTSESQTESQTSSKYQSDVNVRMEDNNDANQYIPIEQQRNDELQEGPVSMPAKQGPQEFSKQTSGEQFYNDQDEGKKSQTNSQEMNSQSAESNVKMDQKMEVTNNDSQSINVSVNLPPGMQDMMNKQPEQQQPIENQNSKSLEEDNGFNVSDLNCLYVEDQIDSQILFKVQMKDLNKVEFAPSLEVALPLIKSKKFNFIVMDMNLQGEYNGLDALRIIRKLPGYEHTPIIAATAYVLPGDKEKFIQAGFNDFLSKPIMRDKLIDCVEQLMG